jgi:hypothetical protein
MQAIIGPNRAKAIANYSIIPLFPLFYRVILSAIISEWYRGSMYTSGVVCPNHASMTGFVPAYLAQYTKICHNGRKIGYSTTFIAIWGVVFGDISCQSGSGGCLSILSYQVERGA